MCLDLRGRRSFRVQPNAAPLKHPEAAASDGCFATIPRSTERGSIEAPAALLPILFAASIPRSTERGSIEALSHGIGSDFGASFRVQPNAAPLKRRREAASAGV